MTNETLTRMDLAEAVFEEVGLSRNDVNHPDNRCIADARPRSFQTCGRQTSRIR